MRTMKVTVSLLTVFLIASNSIQQATIPYGGVGVKELAQATNAVRANPSSFISHVLDVVRTIQFKIFTMGGVPTPYYVYGKSSYVVINERSPENLTNVVKLSNGKWSSDFSYLPEDLILSDTLRNSTVERTMASGTKVYTMPDVFFEAIRFLKDAPTVSPLKLSESLSAAAYDHSKDVIASGRFKEMVGVLPPKKKPSLHIGSDGSTFDVRIARRVEYQCEGGVGISGAENILTSSAGTWYGPTMTILKWIIDDGEDSRGHRTNIFKDSTYVGFGAPSYSLSSYNRYGQVVTMLLSTPHSTTRGKTCSPLVDTGFLSTELKALMHWTVPSGLNEEILVA